MKQSQESRQRIIDLILLALVGLTIQGFWTWQVREPTYMDAFYYTTNGQRLAQGYGFTEQVIWQYLDSPEELPVPSHTYWMPFTSILAAAGYSLGDSFRAAQLPFWLLSGLLPLLSYAIVNVLRGERWQAWAAALFTAAGGYYSAFLAQPTTFAPFAWAGASCLLFIGLILSVRSSQQFGGWKKLFQKQELYLFLTGLTAGMAHLTRADGLLFLLLALGFWIFKTAKWGDKNSDNKSGSELGAVEESSDVSWIRMLLFGSLIIIAGYALAMGFWLIRSWTISGSPLPQGGAQSLFLTSYDDLFAFDRMIELQSFLDWGLANILGSKLEGLSIGAQTYIAVLGFVFLFPFVIAGLINSLRDSYRKNFIWPVFLYLALLFFIMTLLFTFPGIRGSLFHSSIAVWPWSMALASFGIGLAIDWVSKRLPHWEPSKAKPRFAVMFIIIAFIVGAAISWPRTRSIENGEVLTAVGEQLPDDTVMMAGNAPAVYFYTGLSALSVPNEPIEKVLDAAAKYGATHLLLDENYPQPLVDLYHGAELHPGVKLIGSYDNIKLYRLEYPGSDNE